MHVLVVLLHARFSVVGPIPFLLAAIFFPGHPYIRGFASATVHELFMSYMEEDKMGVRQ